MLKRTLFSTVAIAAFACAGVASAAGDPSFTITNDSSHTLTSILVSEPGAADWEHEVLSTEVGPGDTVEITVDVDSCNWDIQATYDDDDTDVADNVDLCALDGHEYTIVDDDSQGDDEDDADDDDEDEDDADDEDEEDDADDEDEDEDADDEEDEDADDEDADDEEDEEADDDDAEDDEDEDDDDN